MTGDTDTLSGIELNFRPMGRYNKMFATGIDCVTNQTLHDNDGTIVSLFFTNGLTASDGERILKGLSICLGTVSRFENRSKTEFSAHLLFKPPHLLHFGISSRTFPKPTIFRLVAILHTHLSIMFSNTLEWHTRSVSTSQVCVACIFQKSEHFKT